MPCFAAAPERNAWIGPSPSRSRTASLSRSASPIRQNHSGRTASCAPLAAASATSAPAASRFAATDGPDTICTAAALKDSFMIAPVPAQRRLLRRPRAALGCGLRARPGYREFRRAHAKDLRILPAAGDLVLVGEHL